MYKDFIDEYIWSFGDEFKYKGFNFLAGDTTVIKVPNVSKCKEEFPVEEGKPARVRLSTFAHVCSGFIYTSEIVEKKSSEQQLAITHLKDLVKRNIADDTAVIYDRGYGGFELIFTHLDFRSRFQ